MTTMNLADSDFSKNARYLTDIDEVIKKIRNGAIESFKVKNEYIPGTPYDNMVEEIFDKRDIHVIYVDEKHPFLLGDGTIFHNIISKEFFNQHKEQIKEALIYQLLHKDWKVTFTPLVYSPSLLEEIINRGIKHIDFIDIELTDKEINLLRTNLVESESIKNGKKESISSKYVIGLATLDSVQSDRKLLLSYKELDNVHYPNLSYIREGKVIKILDDSYVNEEDNYKRLKKFLEKLDEVGKHFTVKLTVESRKKFADVFKKKRYKNINIMIFNDLSEYQYEEYLEEEEILDNLVKPVIEANLSPFERFLAVYNIVKNFKPYKENIESKLESRKVKYVLYNDYMVCVSFARLLVILCDKVGVNCNYYDVHVDTSYDKGFTIEDKVVENVGHARVMVSMDDEKYSVHGLFVSDPTWDNNLDKNLLNHALMTYNKVLSSKRFLRFDITQPILDIQTFDDFVLQVNFYLKRLMHNGSILTSYNVLVKSILFNIKCDPEIKEYYEMYTECITEDDYKNLLTSLGKYLLTRVNKTVYSETIIRASVNAEAAIKKLSDEEKEELYRKTKAEYDIAEMIYFPYVIDANNNHRWNKKGNSK